ncbi:DNA-binding transcriptional regulator, LysR family [Ruania alba]|uniref:DNA-binding transcriptional regulator, LysR family n=2 Tax=Ruania alba TaxID=648782 RepID=A0A1H5N2V3_9MICO|nr:DNA-binding transcriptional regulator, LysR family [Ruania alba]
MTLEQLRGFVAVAEELHFGRAAARLQMTQPPLSRQIQKLERTIGAQLLARSHRDVTLTAAGDAFLPQARHILALADIAPDQARRAARGDAGVIRLGFTATAAIGVLGTILRAMDEGLPDVEVILHEWVSSRQLENLRDGRLDIALTRTVPHDPTLRSRVVHQESLLLALGTHDPLATASEVTPADLEGHTVIGYSPTDAAYFENLTSAVLATVNTRRQEQLSQVHSILALVAAGRGAAVVPRSASQLHPDGVTFRELAGWRSPVVQLHAVWRDASTNPALHPALNLLPTPARLPD